MLYNGPVTALIHNPAAIVLDKSGKAVAWGAGSINWSNVRNLLEALAER